MTHRNDEGNSEMDESARCKGCYGGSYVRENNKKTRFLQRGCRKMQGWLLFDPRQILNNVYLLSAASTRVTQSSCRLQRQMCGLLRTL